jgi:hypothetical protein
MTNEEREKILAESKQHLKDRDKVKQDIKRLKVRVANEAYDPLPQWRASAAQFESEREEGRRELQAEERQLRANTIETMFDSLLARHLPTHLTPLVAEICDATVSAVDALHAQQIEREAEIHKMRGELANLKLELAKLATTLERSSDRAFGVPNLITRGDVVN